MKLVVLQPSYLPWLGYFDQMHQADTFVFYDDVQYDRDGWRNRNRIRTHDGWQWLTVPVQLKGKFGARIGEVEIDPRRPWSKKHIASLSQSYARAPYVKAHLPALQAILSEPWSKIADLSIRLAEHICRELGIETETLRSSELAVTGSRNERLVTMCQRLGATHYLSGSAARSYLDVAMFEQAGVQVEFHDYEHPTYPQVHGEFIPFLSVVDLMFNCGPDSLKILSGGHA